MHLAAVLWIYKNSGYPKIQFPYLPCLLLLSDICLYLSTLFLFVYRVNCVHQKKRLVKKSDWKAGNASTDQLLDSITLTCLNSTGYDVDLSEYICTPACIRPYNTTELYPDWSNTVSPPEMGDTVKYRCNGSQIVSKADFEVGTDRSALKDDVSVTCTFTGKYEPGNVLQCIAL